MKSGGEHIASSESRHDRRYERVTTRAKTDAVLRLLKGESAEAVSEELGVTVSRVERWKTRYMEAGSAELAMRTDESSKGWIAKHSRSIWQWTFLLIVLIAVISFLAVFLQRSPQE
jgi:hypothetical protein